MSSELVVAGSESVIESTGEIVSGGSNVQDNSIFDVSNGGFIRTIFTHGDRPTPMVPVIERHVTGLVFSTSGIAVTKFNGENQGLALGAAFQTFANKGKGFFEMLCRAKATVSFAAPVQTLGNANWSARAAAHLFQLQDADAEALCCEESYVTIEDAGRTLRVIKGVVLVYQDALNQLISDNTPLKMNLPVNNNVKTMDTAIWEESAAYVRENGGVMHTNKVRNTGAIIKSLGFPRGDQRAKALNIQTDAAVPVVAAPIVEGGRQPQGNAAQAQQQYNGRNQQNSPRRQRSTILQGVNR